jgi:hypothetical protein
VRRQAKAWLKRPRAGCEGLSTCRTRRPECKNDGSNEESDPDHFTASAGILIEIDKIIKLKLQRACSRIN